VCLPHYLGGLSAYLQQLDMESTQVGWTSTATASTTRPVHRVGTPGTNGQHAYYQLIHQGTKLIPADFIGFNQTSTRSGSSTTSSWPTSSPRRGAGVRQKTSAEVKPKGVADFQVAHRTFEGNRPTNTILADRLTPATLARSSRSYEHKIFTQGTIWRINSFDQWGVELGKALASRIIPEMAAPAEPKLAHDSSTNALIRKYRKSRGLSVSWGPPPAPW